MKQNKENVSRTKNELQLNEEKGSLGRKLVKVALPIALQSLIGSSLALVDNLMVGSLGEAELNAVGVGGQIFFIHWMVLFGFTSGCSTFMAQFYGVKDISNIQKTAGVAMTVTSCVSLLFFAAGMLCPQLILRIFTRFPEIIELGAGYVRYASLSFLALAVTIPLTSALRATQQTHLPLIISATAFATNTLLNYLLIFGKFGFPRMGIEGAAAATMTARLLEMSLLVYVVFFRNNLIKGKLGDFFRFNRELAGRVIRNAVPTTLNETLWGIGTALYVAAFARIGITEGAAVQACNTINNLFIMAGFSIGDATLILVGQRLGEGRTDEAYHLAKRLVKIAVLIGLIAGGGLILSGNFLLGMFEFTPRGQKYAFLILVVYGCTMWLSLYTATNITGVLRCGGDTKFAMLAEVLTVWCIGVPMAFFTALVLHWPIYFAVLAVKAEELVKAIVLTWRFLSRKWAKNVITEIESKETAN